MTDKERIKVDPKYFRPTEVEQLLGDSKTVRQVVILTQQAMKNKQLVQL